jgi:hypothetical protein
MKSHFFLGMGLALAAAPALAAALPYKAAPPVEAVQGWYVWVDGMYERVNLPGYRLGMHNTAAAGGFPDAGINQQFNPHLDGGGVRGAVGYIVPNSNYRIEVGGSWVGASGSTSQSTLGQPNDISLFFLNGAGRVAFVCAATFNCPINGTLNTNYSSWQGNGTVLYDWKANTVSMTTSVALFGGTSRAHQTLSQTFAQINGAGALQDSGTYFADTRLRWTDIGGRVGLEGSVPVTLAFAVGAKGWVGMVSRHTTFDGSDVGTSTPGVIFNGASVISASDNRAAFVANAEVGASWRFAPAWTLRAFAGVNFDGSVPGITNPTYAGSVNAPTSTTPAAIYYRDEWSGYAGAGLRWQFSGPVVAKY